ncbi:MAG: methyltransferase [bacterium]
MNLSDEIITPEKIRQLAASFQQSRVLLTAIELNLFTVIDNHLITSKEVSEKINIDERATDRIMNALTAMGFLRKTKNKFYNEQHSKEFLVEGKPGYMGGLRHTANLWHNWTSLTAAVKKGSCVKENPGERDEQHWESFIAAMHSRGVSQAKILSYMLDFSNVHNILDVGGGSGAFSMSFVKSKPNITATVFDLPPVIPIAKRYVEEVGLTSSIKFIAGDYLEDSFAGKYDMLFLSAIVHINSFDENKTLIKKCAEALNKGGQIVIQDFVMEDDRTSPALGTIFSLNMLVGTESGDTYTEKEITSWLADAGITNCERKDTGFGTALIIGCK